ncbi:MAG: hypothetical protein ACR2HF_09635, partial [Methylococcaceae bacterium]
PTTHPEARYGTPEMVEEVRALLRKTEFTLIAMGGHEDGMIALGATPEQTALMLIKALAQALASQPRAAPVRNNLTDCAPE